MPNTTKPFGYDPNDITALELALSPERLQPYIARAGGSRTKAVLIYERNTALSEALYGVTQATEIGLRNSIHRSLSTTYGPMWFDHVTFEDIQAEKVANAKHEVTKNGRTVTPGAIVAELNLGFWTSLVSARYEKALWVPHLHKAFPHAVIEKRGSNGTISYFPISRALIFEQLERIRTLRNRIAHHESILKFDLPKLYTETLGALKWVCPVSAEWVHSTNCFAQRFHEKPLSYAPMKLPPAIANPIPGLPKAT